MSRRNNDAITIHSILSWIEDNLESPLSLEKVSERSGYSKWHLQRMFKKETGHSLGQYIRSRKLTEIAQKLKQSNEPILYLAETLWFRVAADPDANVQELFRCSAPQVSHNECTWRIPLSTSAK